MDKLLIIDGFNLLSRGYFATVYQTGEENLPRNEQGVPINGIRVFIQKLFQLIAKHETSHVAICWDVKREDTERRESYQAYKATRSALPEPLITQYESLVFLLTDLGFSQLTIPPYEADDVIGALTVKFSKENEGHSFMYSNDHDLLQLLTPSVTQVMAKNKQEVLFTEELFKETYGIMPDQWIDVKALLGDAGDNVPGVRGVGEKSALPLIKQYHNIERLFETIDTLDPVFKRYKSKLINGQADAFMSKALVTIQTNIDEVSELDLEGLRYRLDKETALTVLNQFGLRLRLGW